MTEATKQLRTKLKVVADLGSALAEAKTLICRPDVLREIDRLLRNEDETIFSVVLLGGSVYPTKGRERRIRRLNAEQLDRLEVVLLNIIENEIAGAKQKLKMKGGE